MRNIKNLDFVKYYDYVKSFFYVTPETEEETLKCVEEKDEVKTNKGDNQK